MLAQDRHDEGGDGDVSRRTSCLGISDPVVPARDRDCATHLDDGAFGVVQDQMSAHQSPHLALAQARRREQRDERLQIVGKQIRQLPHLLRGEDHRLVQGVVPQPALDLGRRHFQELSHASAAILSAKGRSCRSVSGPVYRARQLVAFPVFDWIRSSSAPNTRRGVFLDMGWSLLPPTRCRPRPPHADGHDNRLIRCPRHLSVGHQWGFRWPIGSIPVHRRPQLGEASAQEERHSSRGSRPTTDRAVRFHHEQ